MPPNDDLKEVLRLTKDNNRMLHAMRRNAFLGGIIRLIIWAIVLGVPIWLFFTYRFAGMQSIMEAFEQVQGAGTSAQLQLENFQDSLRELQSNVPFLPQNE